MSLPGVKGQQSGGAASAITPSDSADLNYLTRGLYVGVSGDVAVVMADGKSVTFVSLAAGIIHPLSVQRVDSTNTTATSIVGVY